MRIYWAVPFVLACTGESVLEKQENVAPSVLIVSHSDGVAVQDGYIENFRATVSDENDVYGDLLIAWYVGDEVVCDWAAASPAGDSLCEIVFTEGDSSVIVEVRDPQGAGGRAELTVEVLPTEAPIIELLTPDSGGSYYSDQLIQFSALVSDLEDSAEDLIVTWTSNVDGELALDSSINSDGEISDYTYLTEGNHAIELRVEDSSGKFSTEEVVVRVGGENNLPVCSITNPLDGDAFVAGDLIVFRGDASDADIPATDLSIEWLSDKDGLLGTATASSNGQVTFSTDVLSTNGHTISMNVQDEIGALCSAQIFMTVGTPPMASIDEPLDGGVFAVGDTITFRGTVSDTEDNANAIAVEWNSDITGTLNSGFANSQGISQFTSSNLVAGVHSVSFSATDTSGLVADDLISFRIDTPPVVDSLTLSPDPVYGGNTLVATAMTSDADGHNVTTSYVWFENGVQTTFAGTTIAPSELDVGEVWTVRATPNDGFMDGSFVEASITVSNSLPVLNNETISSSDGAMVYNDSTLTCTASATDADQAITPTYVWSIGGVLASGTTVDLSNYSVSVGDVVECVITAIDAQGASVTSSVQEMVDNRAPVIGAVQVTPSTPVLTDTLDCMVTATDLEGDSTTTAYNWTVNSASVGSTQQLALSSVSVAVGDTVECSVTVTDVHGDASTNAQSVVIQNTAPTISLVSLTPIEPTLSDVLTCSVTGSDLEDGQPQFTFDFQNQTTGQIFGATTTLTSSATLDLSQVTANYQDIIACTVTATDSHGDSVSDIQTVTVLNTSPVFDQAATISPSTGVEMGTNLTCSAVASDPDDGVDSLIYLWQVNGSQVSTGNTWTTNSTDASVGDTVTCVAIATDFDGNVTTSTSSSVQIANTIPVVSNVALDDLSPQTNDVLGVSLTSGDANGDSVTMHYEWHVIDASQNGQDLVVFSGSGALFSTLDGATYFDKGDEVYVRTTPNDGIDNGSTVESDHAMVVNTAPTTPVVAVSSSATVPLEGVDDLTCMITSLSSDADGDPVSYVFDWYDGSNVLQQSNSTTNTVDIFFGGNTTAGLWSCEVTVTDGMDTAVSSDTIEVDSEWGGAITFTNCGATGRTGPSASACTSEYNGSNLDSLVSVNAGIQSWTVDSAGTYSIEVWGASGGNGYGGSGGDGTYMYGEFTLNQGDVLNIIVGQEGENANKNQFTAGSGGGGTFVWLSTDTSAPLIAAGGGGGAGGQQGNAYAGVDGTTNNSGTSANGVNTAAGGILGEGGNSCGTSDHYHGGAAGGGWSTSGQNSCNGNITWSDVAFGGDSVLSGALGGLGSSQYGTDGGFGSGGGSNIGGGGGGGYSGGAAGNQAWTSPWSENGGGGGGSYNTGTNNFGTSGDNSGHGYVIIDRL